MVTVNEQYSYDILMRDIEALQARYPQFIRVETLGYSVLGREIPILILGNDNATKQVWVDGAIHGREYMTSQVVMMQVERLLQISKEAGTFVWPNVQYHIAPMLNPDGVELSRFGLSSVADPARKLEILAINRGSEDFTRYKANANGVDLNSNFPAYWEQKDTGVYAPAPEGFKGYAPLSQPETQAVAQYIQRRLDASVSYHAVGAEIYWYFYQTGDALERDRAVAIAVGNITDYTLMPEEDSLSGAGLRDYQILDYGRIGLTIEIGPTTTAAPPPLSDLDVIWERNRDVLLKLPLYIP